MNNEYEVRGEVTAIFLESPKYGLMEAHISTNKLERVNEFPNKWMPCWSPTSQSFRVIGKMPRNGGLGKTVYLHRWVTSAPSDLQVDHINSNPLDNTDSNLRVATIPENGQNRKGANRNSTTGIRGVAWHAEGKKWQAYLDLNRKRKYLGLFSNIEEAERAVKEARAKYMQFSKEALAN